MRRRNQAEQSQHRCVKTTIGSSCVPRIFIRCSFAPNPIRSQFKCPCKYQRHGQTEDQEKRQSRYDPVRQIQRRSHDLFYLHDQPAHDDLGKCNFEDVAAFQFVKQTHLHFRTFNVHVINHQTGIIRKQMPRRLAIPTFNPAHSSKPFALINSPQCFPAQASKSEEVRIASVQ